MWGGPWELLTKRQLASLIYFVLRAGLRLSQEHHPDSALPSRRHLLRLVRQLYSQLGGSKSCRKCSGRSQMLVVPRLSLSATCQFQKTATAWSAPQSSISDTWTFSSTMREREPPTLPLARLPSSSGRSWT